MKRNIIILIYILFAFVGSSIAQTKLPYPIIGDTLENHQFYDLDNYPTKTANLNDFRGKWVILDMWGYTCTGCINSFPKMNKLAQRFKDNVQIIMVGATKGRVQEPVEKNERITKAIYTRLKKAYNIKMTVAFDSIFYLKHDVGSLPQIFIISPNGVVVAKTNTIDSIKIAEMIRGRLPEFNYSNSYSETARVLNFNSSLPLLTSGQMANGGIDTSYLFRSLLIPKQKIGFPGGEKALNLFRTQKLTGQNEWVTKGRLETFDTSVEHLYYIAFFGLNFWESYYTFAFHKFSKLFKTEVKDTIRLNEFLEETYSYSLTVPKNKSSREFLMNMMQTDLNNYFDYRVTREKANMPVFYLDVVDKKKVTKFISNKQREPVDLGNLFHQGVYYMKDFANYLELVSAFKFTKMPIIDRTGIVDEVFFEFEANCFDTKDIEAKLLLHGLKLTRAEKEMDVIVIRDK